MTDKETGQLAVAAALSGDEIFTIVQDGESVQVTLDALSTWLLTEASIVPENLPYRGARVALLSNVTLGAATVVIPWSSEVRDTDGIWSVGDATKLVIPVGVTKVRVSGSLDTTGYDGAAGLYGEIRKNKTGTTPDPVDGSASYSDRKPSLTGQSKNIVTVFTDVLDVTAGDYFELMIVSSASGFTNVVPSANTWFALEIVEADLP